MISKGDPITTISGGTLKYQIYFSKYYAEKASNFLTSNVAAFDFTGLPYYGVYDSLYGNSSVFFRFFLKDSSSTTWSALSDCAVSPSGLGSYANVYGVWYENIIWDSLTGDFVYDAIQGLHISLPSRNMDYEVHKVKTRMEIAKNAKKGDQK